MPKTKPADSAQQRMLDIVKNLRKFAAHKRECPRNKIPQGTCNCGFLAVWRETEEFLKSQPADE